MYKYKIIVGNISGDGYDRGDIFNIFTSHIKKDLVKAYKKFVKKHKLSLKDICYEDGDHYIDEDMFQKISSAGVNMDNVELSGDAIHLRWVDPENIVELLMEMIKTEIPDLNWEFEKECEFIDELSGFGYGCY